MKLILLNNSSDAFSYLSGTVVVPASSSLDVPSLYWFSLYTDPSLINDIRNGNLRVNDGNKELPLEQSESYLKLINDFNYNNRDTDGASIVRVKAAKKGWAYASIPIEFATSRLKTDSSYYSKDADGNDRPGITLKIYDANNNEITTPGLLDANYANAVKTVIDFEPAYDYEVIGGTMRTISDITANVRLWIIAVPDVPAPTGSKEMVGGINLNYLVPANFYGVDGRVAKYLPYNATYHTNKLRFIFKYPAGTNENIQINIELYRQ